MEEHARDEAGKLERARLVTPTRSIRNCGDLFFFLLVVVAIRDCYWHIVGGPRNEKDSVHKEENYCVPKAIGGFRVTQW